MTENTADYNKRTCIICGCHTAQTINIYEPRSGPNIVQLIQARFKFQPLNDDKYLCYSCNNWLINWHSLQAVNSNNSDNSAITSRTNFYNAKPETNSTFDVKSKIVQCSKPIAIVKPRIREQSHQSPKDVSSKIDDRSVKSDRPKMGVLNLQQQRTSLRKLRSSVFKKVIPLYNYCQINKSTDIFSQYQKEHKSLTTKNICCNLVSETTSSTGSVEEQLPPITLPYLPRKSSGTSIDGKLVSMLRRIGTTLSKDLNCTLGEYKPVKNTQAVGQVLVDNEIIINFNTAVSEVLYYNEKKLTYDAKNSSVDSIIISSSDDEDELDIGKHTKTACEVNTNGELNLEKVFSLVPKGVSVSIISDSC